MYKADRKQGAITVGSFTADVLTPSTVRLCAFLPQGMSAVKHKVRNADTLCAVIV